MESKSLSTVQLLDKPKKHEIYMRSLNALHGLKNNEIKYEKELTDIYEFFQSTFPGWKRVSIHATRRKLEDPDLVFLEQTIRFCLNNWFNGKDAYFLSQYFCCSYEKYRSKMTKKSSFWVMDITQYCN